MQDRPRPLMDRSQDGLRQLLHDLESLFGGDRSLGVCTPAMVSASSISLSGFLLPDAQPSPSDSVENRHHPADADRAGAELAKAELAKTDLEAADLSVADMLRQVLGNQARILDRLDRLEQLVQHNRQPS